MQREKKFEDILFLDDGWEIESDDGFHPINVVCKTVPYDVWKIETDSHSLKCADDHILFDENKKEVFAKNLKEGKKIITENGVSNIVSVEKTNKKENMYDVQVSSDEHSYYANGILSHNTTVSVIFILHYILFNQDKSVVLLAHKGSQAREILSRLKLAYSLLPKWMQVGIVEWNKGSIVLENGSSVIAAATSSNTIRGMSFSCVTGDTKVCVCDDYDNVWNMDIKDIIGKKYIKKVLTSKGFKHFSGVMISERREKVKITFPDGIILKCTPDHKIFYKDSFVEVRTIQDDSLQFEYYEDDEPVYDLLDVEDTHSYLTNGILSHNCVFLDECVSGESLVTVRNKKTGEIMDISMRELWNMQKNDKSNDVDKPNMELDNEN